MHNRLSLSELQPLRTVLAAALQSQPTPQLCWQLGQQCDTPGTAFFIGYQAAMRCLDPSLPATMVAAFCISERGVRNPWQMQSVLISADFHLTGHKSYAMLAGCGLDRVYIVVRQDDDLVAVMLNTGEVDVLPGGAQPFLPDLPHGAITFNRTINAGDIFCTDAHARLNKPFRCWEDVHAGLALAGWLQQFVLIDEQAVNAVMQAFREHPQGYTLRLLDAVEHLLRAMDCAAQSLPDGIRMIWQRDSVLLRFAQPIRDSIRQKLSAPSP